MPRLTVETSALAPFVRRGIEGGCIACRQPISDHLDHRGQWIGCQAEGLPDDVPFLLIPDRRIFNDRRLSPAPEAGTPTPPPDGDRRKQPAPPVQAPPRRVQATPRTLTPPPLPKPVQRAPSGSQVVYVARVGVTARPVQELPPHDRKVFGLIVRRKLGATRAQLLADLHTKSTGKVDGAVRRLRLRNVIKVRPVQA